MARAVPGATFREVFAAGEFRALRFSEILSVAGDRLALVALTLLVYDRARSPLLAGLVYATGYLPWVIGGLFLSELAAPWRARWQSPSSASARRWPSTRPLHDRGGDRRSVCGQTRRSQAFGIASMGVIVGQGATLVAAGAAAEVMTPAAIIAVGGGIGAVAAFALTLRWRHVSPPGGRHAAKSRAGRVATGGAVRLRGSGSFWITAAWALLAPWGSGPCITHYGVSLI